MFKKIKKKEKPEFDQKLIDVARVVRIVAGGRRFRFRTTVVIGNRKGKVGMGIGKAGDVTSAVTKAVASAKKNLIEVPIVNGTIPHEVSVKYGGAQVFLKPARAGTGIIAGGPVRAVVELSGVKDIVSKIQGSSNKPNNVRATIIALKRLRKADKVKRERGKQVVEKKENKQNKAKNKKIPKK